MIDNNIKFRESILEWYRSHHRILPWRQTKDPYRIWLSEIILQQTRVNQGLPYYNKFVSTFPTVTALGKAPLENVLRLWQGLGYYSRARNLHACAQQIITQYNGEFPQTYQELLQLKGIGKYTAAAIASFAFDEVVPTVDGNAFRFFARYLGLDYDIGQAKTFKIFFEVIQQYIDPKHPAVFNQAVMEMGATCCTHKNPQCRKCPFSTTCYAYINEKINSLPIKTKKLKIKTRHLHYFIFQHENVVYMHERKGKGIWQGLYQFALCESLQQTATEKIIEESLPQSVINNGLLKSVSPIIKHLLTHQKLFITFYHWTLDQPLQEAEQLHFGNLMPHQVTMIDALPKPVVIADFWENFQLK